MNIERFNGEVATAANEFMHYWKKQQKGNDKKNYPPEMDVGEWWEQFIAWLEVMAG